MKLFQNKVFIKLLISLCVVFLLPIIILWALYSSQISSIVNTEVQKMVSSSQSESIHLLELELQATENTVKLFQKNAGYQYYLDQGFAYDEAGDSALYHLENDMAQIYYLMNLPDNFFLSFPDDDAIFAKVGLFRTANYMERENLKDDVSLALRDPKEYPVLRNGNSLISANQSEESANVLLFYPLFRNFKQHTATAAFSIPAERLAGYFDINSDEFHTKTVVFCSAGNYLFSHNAESALLDHALYTDLEQGITEDYSVDRNQYTVWKYISAYNGWQYVTLLPKQSDFYKRIFQINNFFRVYVFLTVALGSFLILGFMDLNYRPILKLRKNTSQLLNDEIGTPPPSNDDFQTIEMTLQSLQHRNISLKQKLDKDLQSVQNFRLQCLLNNYYNSIHDFNVDCEQIGMQYTSASFFVSVFQLSLAYERMDDILAALREFLTAHIESYAMYLPQKRMLVYVHGTNSTVLPKKEIFEDAVTYLKASYGIDALVGIGHVHPGITAINRSHMQATSALEHCRKVCENGVSTYDEALDYYHDSYFRPAKELNQLESAFIKGDTELCRNTLHALTVLLQDRKFSSYNVRCVFFDVACMFQKYAEELKSATHLLPDLFTQLNLATGKPELIRVMDGFSEKIFIESTIVPPQDDLIIQIKSYIKQNYQRYDFSVQQIADRFDMLPNVIGSIFKQKQGIGLLDYLISCRIGSAKDLLINTDMPIKDIALQVGYYNVSSFIRRFKQLEGITPSEYRSRRNRGTSEV